MGLNFNIAEIVEVKDTRVLYPEGDIISWQKITGQRPQKSGYSLALLIHRDTLQAYVSVVVEKEEIWGGGGDF